MLNNITIQDAEPPTDEVKEALKEVETPSREWIRLLIMLKNTSLNSSFAAEAEVGFNSKDAKAQKVNRIA